MRGWLSTPVDLDSATSNCGAVNKFHAGGNPLAFSPNAGLIDDPSWDHNFVMMLKLGNEEELKTSVTILLRRCRVAATIYNVNNSI